MPLAVKEDVCMHVSQHLHSVSGFHAGPVAQVDRGLRLTGHFRSL